MAAPARDDADEPLDLEPLLPAGQALLAVDGMWCPSCAAAVERVMERVPGVTSARVTFATASALVRWDPDRLDPAALVARVTGLGYGLGRRAAPDATAARIGEELRRHTMRLAVAGVLGMWAMLLSLLLYLDSGGIVGTPVGLGLAAAATALAVPVVFGAGWPFLLAGWRTLRAGVPGMDALISLGALTALGLSAWRLARGEAHVYADTAVMLVTLLIVGRLVEMAATRRSVLAIAALQDVLPETADVLAPDGTMETRSAAEVTAGAVIRVAAGQRVPLDGVVADGASSLDRAVLTGESAPVPTGPGAVVEAGCVNLLSALDLRVTHGVGARAVDRIGARVADVLGEKGETQRLAERVARILVPAALVLAAGTVVVGLAVGLTVDEALLRATSVLVIACPCAVGVAVPLAWVAAARRAAGFGVLFRTPAALESLATVREAMFDKTGTLTEGRPRVVHVDNAPGETREAVLADAAGAETGILHPLALALREAAPTADAGHHRPERLGRAVRWRGPRGLVVVGAPDGVAAEEIAVPPSPDPPPVPGATVLEVARDGAWIGRVHLADTARADAADALAALARLGVAVRIVTGDAAPPAHALARRLDVPADRVHAGCTPEDKAALVAEAGRPAAFIGDGVNDSIALARAAAGIAVEDAAGAATGTASIVLAGGHGLGAVAEALHLARRARRVMWQNLGFALVYNGAGLTLAVLGAVPPVAAAIAMVASSASVTANSARLAWAPRVEGRIVRRRDAPS